MLLDIKELSFSYRTKTVLNKIALQGEGGRIICILGKNGVGKSTLMKCICKILKPEKQVIFVDDKDVRKYSRNELARNVSYVPQMASATRARVFDAILIGRHPYVDWNVTRKDLDIVTETIEAVGLQELAMRFVDELSGGELQKVQIARAIVQQPRVLLLDEPTNNLDIANQWQIMNLIVDLSRSRDLCTMITMHDINIAIQYSDELIFMKDGNIIYQCEPAAVNEDIIKEVYGVDVQIVKDRDMPLVVPKRTVVGWDQ